MSLSRQRQAYRQTRHPLHTRLSTITKRQQNPRLSSHQLENSQKRHHSRQLHALILVTVRIRVPAVLHACANNRGIIATSNTALTSLITSLSTGFPNLGSQIISSTNLQHFIGICLGSRSIQFLSNLKASLSSNSSIAVLPTITNN